MPAWAWVMSVLAGIWLAHDSLRPSVPWFRRTRNRPAIYLFHSVGRPELIKVGYTSRRTEARQAELERKLGDRLVLVRRIRMPHAWVAEQRAHRMLRARGWRLDWAAGLGGEWYLVPGGAGVREAALLMEAAARDIERQARRRFSWHETAEVTIHDTPAFGMLP